MNCEGLNLYEYLEGTLSPSEKAAAERHLSGCNACREAVRQEQQVAESLSSRLAHAVETVALGVGAQARMAATVERKIVESHERTLVSFWRRLALPLAAAVAFLLIAASIGHRIAARHDSPLEVVRAPSRAREIPIHISYRTPSYTFRKEGNMVIDALTSEPQTVDGAMLVKN